jgi:hypothetical protein
MTPADAIRESRVSIAVDTTYHPPLLYYCSPLSLNEVRAALFKLKIIAFPEALSRLSEKQKPAARSLVPLDKAEATEQWEPVAPKSAVDKLAELS